MSEAQVFIDHLTIPVRDPEASRRFYRQALAPLGVEEVELEGGVGWGPPGRVDFFIRQGEPTAPLHLAFGTQGAPKSHSNHADDLLRYLRRLSAVVLANQTVCKMSE